MSVRALRRGAIASSRVQSAGTTFLSSNNDGSQEGVFNGSQYTNLAFAFTPTSSCTVVGVQIRYGTGTIPTASGAVRLATYADPLTTLSSSEALSVSSADQGTWKSVVFASPVALTGGTEYLIRIGVCGQGAAYKTTGASTFVGLTATRVRHDTNWALVLSGYTGGFRIEVQA